MNYMHEYISRGLSSIDLQNELLSMIKAYNKLRGTYLLIYATSTNKGVPDAQVTQEDYYFIRDMLADKKGSPNLDVYLETPGGSGEAAEEIVEFFHDNFGRLSFVISGAAKSAGTIMVLGGDEILMTETGSLGPIDAQVVIGRSIQSAHDYIDWIESKIKEAAVNGALNPVDAVMIAQVTPGEIGRVNHALKFAQDLVEKWLPDHKFKDWNTTESQKKTVTPEMKRARASEIAKVLCNHSKWRTHGRSLKKNDLINEIKLRVIDIDADAPLANLVYRIHTLCRMICDVTPAYKIFATEDAKIFKNASPRGIPGFPDKMPAPEVFKLDSTCPKCGTHHKIYGKFGDNKSIDENMKREGYVPLPPDKKVKCPCGFEIDLQGPVNDIESKLGRKIVYSVEDVV